MNIYRLFVFFNIIVNTFIFDIYGYSICNLYKSNKNKNMIKLISENFKTKHNKIYP